MIGRACRIFYSWRHLLAAFLFLVATQFCMVPTGAAEPPLRHLFVSGSAGGILELKVPADWTRVGPSTPIDMRFTRAGARDNLRLTAFPVPRERLASMTDEKMQETLRSSGEKVRVASVEQKLDLKPLAVAGGRGYYFSVTDKHLANKPDTLDGFRYLHSGIVQFGGWAGVFTIFTNDKDGVFVKEALAAMGSLRWVDPALPERATAKGLDRARLSGAAVPAAWVKKDELLCNSNQARNLYEQFNDLYSRLLSVRTVKTSFESYDAGQNDTGSVLYLEFDATLGQDGRAFVAGLLWGDQLPTPAHPEEFFISGKYLVIWCTRTESAIKRLSQSRLESLVFGGK